MAQRLIRKICPFCKEELKNVPENIYEKMKIPAGTPIYHGKGCEKCEKSGYKGRTAIFEILAMTRDIRELIVKDATDLEIRDKAVEQGFVTLRAAAIKQMLAGVTTIDEVMSVTIASV
jgi:type IV pilus assembly protein PilB